MNKVKNPTQYPQPKSIDPDRNSLLKKASFIDSIEDDVSIHHVYRLANGIYAELVCYKNEHRADELKKLKNFDVLCRLKPTFNNALL